MITTAPIAKVNKIIPFSAVDGPGNRSAIFLQGCNFNCQYCHNPETIKECIGCQACLVVCPTGALTLEAGKIHYDITKCILCDACIKACMHNSSPRIRELTAAQVMAEITPNIPFIRGLTLSGGECTRWRDFIMDLTYLAQERNLTVLLDSNGSYDFEKDPELMSQIEGVMLDIKAFDKQDHLNLTGVSNELVLKNAIYLAKQQRLTEIRTVILPEHQDALGIIDQIGDLLKESLSKTPIRYKLIKYRPLGVRTAYRMMQSPSDAWMEKLKAFAHEKGFEDVIII